MLQHTDLKQIFSFHKLHFVRINRWNLRASWMHWFVYILWLVSDNIINLKIYGQFLHEKAISLTFFV